MSDCHRIRPARKLAGRTIFIMEDKNTTYCISLVGQPGSGKSTLAAYTFARLKIMGVNCELVTEFAKDLTWENNSVALSNQTYVFAQQFQRMYRCSRSVDVIITDSPLVLSPIYNRDKDIQKPLTDLVEAINGKFRNLYFFMNPGDKYDPVGRKETFEESNEIGRRLKSLLNDMKISYTEIPWGIPSSDIVIDTLYRESQKDGNTIVNLTTNQKMV